MIYTHGLNSSIDHIMIYDGNTPVAIVKLNFYYLPHSIHDCDYDEAGWINEVAKVLLHYAAKHGLDGNRLAAKPVKVINQVELGL